MTASNKSHYHFDPLKLISPLSCALCGPGMRIKSKVNGKSWWTGAFLCDSSAISAHANQKENRSNIKSERRNLKLFNEQRKKRFLMFFIISRRWDWLQKSVAVEMRINLWFGAAHTKTWRKSLWTWLYDLWSTDFEKLIFMFTAKPKRVRCSHWGLNRVHECQLKPFQTIFLAKRNKAAIKDCCGFSYQDPLIFPTQSHTHQLHCSLKSRRKMKSGGCVISKDQKKARKMPIYLSVDTHFIVKAELHKTGENEKYWRSYWQTPMLSNFES